MFQLTEKQTFVIEQFSRGRTTKEIAAHNGVSEQAIREQSKAVCRKLGAVNLVNAIAIYTKQRLTDEIMGSGIEHVLKAALSDKLRGTDLDQLENGGMDELLEHISSVKHIIEDND